MGLLKKENWLVCLILNILTEGLFTFLLGYYLKVYDKDAWYAKWQYWVFGTICFIFPVFIMLGVFSIEISVKVAAKLDVSGKEIYDNPYTWILCLIVPVIGWIMLIVMSIYIFVFTHVSLAKGLGEQYID